MFIDFTGFAGDCLINGKLDLRAPRLTDQLNADPLVHLVDVELEDLGNAHAWVLSGLSVIFVSGLLLALSDVKTFGNSPIYWTKMSLVALLLANGALLQRTEQKLRASGLQTPSRAPKEQLWSRLRFAAATSMMLWTAIVLAGVILVASS